MNKAITEGLVLMPPAFSAGLDLWSREDGEPGQGSYAGQSNAATVAADQDFAGCLELLKLDSVQKLRCFQQIPFQPGLYLQVRAKVKCVSGAFPTVRIAAYAGNSKGKAVKVPLTGPEVTLSRYGEVVEVSAIIGSGNRSGVDMAWGTEPVYAHLGLDLTGASGGVVRIDDITVEDVTAVFLRDMLDLVDVRDYGALGDGTTDDAAAFAAADAAAAGARRIFVSAGTYKLASHVTLNSPVFFEGQVKMGASLRLACTRNFDLDTYTAAFGDPLEGLRRALQAIFSYTGHVTLDLSGRRVDVTEPLDVAALAGTNRFEQRRVLANGQLSAKDGTAWEAKKVTSSATYSTSDPYRLTNVANVAEIPVGARVTGNNVPREIYVRAVNVGAGTVELNLPPGSVGGTRTFTFERFRYMLDFSGFEKMSKFEITDMELQCDGIASAILLPPAGTVFRIADCVINKPKDRGITSIGTGCQGLMVDQCQFLSNEQSDKVQDRTTIALNVNSNDTKLRNNRVVKFAHFAVMKGTGHMFIGNHFFHGDDEPSGVRRAGVVLTEKNVKVLFTGNYIDNNFIEWTNEHDPEPDYEDEFSFGGLTVTGNIFTANGVGASFRWLVVTPRGTGQFISGLSVTGNAFRTINATVDRVEAVDESFAKLDYGRFRNVVFEANTFNGITQATANPVTVTHEQNTAASTWQVDASGYLPFASWARNVPAVVAQGAVTTAEGATQAPCCWAEATKGTKSNLVNLRWQQTVKGTALVTIRCDNPI
ncbi:glycosyl hydrolase family 28-related protein [Falsirhodobacter algicola]|uniref:Right-handed parallel beta-helix repeat-containing protein n=1 Tax=Falsirhodobacter algicola TaxID=2692330 RepID=A0A8J8MR93_9RHOB|nr:glycosyl hydrolase family 28-related protein [Falsirhodobacter algicola]QUS35049.1 right-handed parallel beta-helix repeat-containing protein [Falsirhodobacter algicola]